jgi:hypothetical protein
MLGAQELVVLLGCCSVPVIVAVIVFVVVGQSADKPPRNRKTKTSN